MTERDGPDTESGGTVLLVSNRRIDENAGRAEKFATRRRLLNEDGWTLEIGYVEPTTTGLSRGIPRCIKQARHADVINSVSNPPHTQIAGAITARVTGTPWLAEFRDPLVENPDVAVSSPAGRLRSFLERYILTHADRVAWYDGIQIPDDYFARTYPGVPVERYVKLPPIGFEREKFDSIEAEQFDSFTVTYAGSFYEGWIEPYTFLEGLGRFVSEEGHSSDIRALFYGDWTDDYAHAASNAGVSKHVHPREFVPHATIVSVLKGSDVLLYIGGDDPRNRLNLPSKLYDYLGSRRPILAIVDPSFRVADVIRDNGIGIVVEPGDPGGVSDALRRIRSGAFEYSATDETLEQFSRRRSTNAYVELLNELTD